MFTGCYACGEEGHTRAECPTRKKVPAATRPSAVAESGNEVDAWHPPAASLPPAEITPETRKLIDITRAQLQLMNAPELRRYTSRYEQHMWSLRGSLRSRASFALPHPDDFKGGLPRPQEFPGLFPVRLEIRHHVI